MSKHPLPSIEKIAAYLEGNLSQNEMQQFSQIAEQDEALHQLLDASDVVDDTIAGFTDADLQLPQDIIGSDFELPEVGNIDFLSLPTDSFSGNDHLYHQEGINAEENNKQESETLNNKNIMANNSLSLNELGETAGGIGTIEEAHKQYGLEPLNIEYDPNTYQWEQDTCAIRSQELVLRSFGIVIPQSELISEATYYGWYTKGQGTSIADVGNLLDLHNVPNHRMENANVFNLVDELGQGHKVIVGVDVDELYGNSFWQSIKEYLIGKTPNHAMLVSGIDTSDPNNTMVVLTDPGTGKTLFECPYDRFLSAWNDSECFMVATDNPAPLEYNSDTMINFDYDKGHVLFMGKMPFETLHNEIVPNVDNHLDALDEYIESLDKYTQDDAKIQDQYDAHQKAHELDPHKLHNKLSKTILNSSDDPDDEHIIEDLEPEDDSTLHVDNEEQGEEGLNIEDLDVL